MSQAYRFRYAFVLIGAIAATVAATVIIITPVTVAVPMTPAVIVVPAVVDIVVDSRETLNRLQLPNPSPRGTKPCTTHPSNTGPWIHARTGAEKSHHGSSRGERSAAARQGEPWGERRTFLKMKAARDNTEIRRLTVVALLEVYGPELEQQKYT